MQLNLDPGFDADLELAHRALDRGWVSREAIESAILEQERTPGSRLLNLLPLTPDQRRRLETPDARSVPDEIVEAARDPARRVDQYVLGEHLQSGGMGRICKAWDVKLSRWVALKFLKAVGDERSEAYFEREARLAAQLDHPNIATIYGSGQSGGERYIAMQFIPGRTLDAWRRGDPLRLAALVRDAARAVAYANGRGIIHRDLKPMNVMVTPEGRVCVLDFGLARPVDSDARHSATGKAMGTPAYMSPEQARGSAVTARSDVYGLGATLYECLTGKPPFTGKTIYDILRRVEEDAPANPRKWNPHVPADLETIVLKCLEKDPARRYATADGLADDLERFLNHDAISARPSGVVYRTAKLVAKRKAIALASAASLVLAAVLGWWFLVGSPRSEQLRVEGEHLRLREEAMKLWADARGVAMSGADFKAIPPKARAAREAFERALAVQEEALPLVMKSRCHQMEGQHEAALKSLERAYQLDPASVEARIELAKAILGKHRALRGFPMASTVTSNEESQTVIADLRPETAEQRTLRERGEKLLEGGGESPAQKALLAGLLAMCKVEWKDAASAIARYTRLESWDADAMWLEGVSHYYANDCKSAVASFDRALKRSPTVQILWWRGHSRKTDRQLDEAIADFTKVIETDPAYVDAYTARGGAELRKGRVDQAIADFTKALDLMPRAAYLFNCRGCALGEKNRHEEAIADFTKAIEIDSSFVSAYSNRGASHRVQGRLKEAIADFEKCLQLDPKHWPAWLNQGLAYGAQSRRDDAIASFTRVIELNPKHARAYALRAWERIEKELYREALKDFTVALESIKTDPDLWYGRSFCHSYLDLEAEAEADARKSLEVATPTWPNRDKTLRFLASVEAARLFREANQLHASRRYADSIEAFRQIVEKYPRQRQAIGAAYNIACAYALLGQKEKALEWLEKTVELGWKDADHLMKDADLESLRKEERFKRLLDRLKGS